MDNTKVHQVIRFTTLAALLAFIIYVDVFWYNQIFHPKMVTRCGTITFKGNDRQHNKNSYSTEFILVVDYDGKKKDEEVTASTWSSHNVGDRVCFTSKAQLEESFITLIYILIGIVTILAFIVLLSVLIVAFFQYLFTGKVFES